MNKTQENRTQNADEFAKKGRQMALNLVYLLLPGKQMNKTGGTMVGLLDAPKPAPALPIGGSAPCAYNTRRRPRPVAFASLVSCTPDITAGGIMSKSVVLPVFGQRGGALLFSPKGE